MKATEDKVGSGPVANTNYSIPDHLPPEIFRAYDVRGVVGEQLTPNIVYAIGRAYASMAQAEDINNVIIARDGRLSGPELIQALKQGLLDSGMDVIDIGAVPTPVLYFAAYQSTQKSGIMLTGSHNPKDYNGLKMVLNERSLTETAVQNLAEIILAKKFVSGEGRYKTADVVKTYIDEVIEKNKLDGKLNIVIDCGNGITGMIAPQLFEQLGCKVTALFHEVDGSFPNHHPDPTVPGNLASLIDTVRAQNADIGIAFDGDGDRCGIVTNKGEIIWPDRQLMLFAIDLLSRHPGAEIIYDVKCTRNVSKVIKEHGGKPLMWKTGHSLIKEKMREKNALLAGEMSGHLFFKEGWYGFDDGMFTAARLLAYLSRQDKTLSEIFDDLPENICTPEIKVAMRDDRKFEFIDALVKKASFPPEAKITTIDGLRVDLPNAWGLVRASNTTPYLTCRFEGEDGKDLEKIERLFHDEMLKINPELELPF